MWILYIQVEGERIQKWKITREIFEEKMWDAQGTNEKISLLESWSVMFIVAGPVHPKDNREKGHID